MDTMATKNMTGSVRTVCIVAFPGAEILDITGPMEVFAFANIGLRDSVITEPTYQMALLAEKPGPLRTSCGLTIIADRAYSEVTDGIDTLLIAGAPDVNSVICDPVLTDWVRTMAPRVRRVERRSATGSGAQRIVKQAAASSIHTGISRMRPPRLTWPHRVTAPFPFSKTL
jgi:transcriptional regulator GlxA family with amidase domain